VFTACALNVACSYQFQCCTCRYAVAMSWTVFTAAPLSRSWRVVSAFGIGGVGFERSDKNGRFFPFPFPFPVPGFRFCSLSRLKTVSTSRELGCGVARGILCPLCGLAWRARLTGALPCPPRPWRVGSVSPHGALSTGARGTTLVVACGRRCSRLTRSTLVAACPSLSRSSESAVVRALSCARRGLCPAACLVPIDLSEDLPTR